MKKLNVELKELSFDNTIEIFKAENYSESGFYIVTDETHKIVNLVLVNKKNATAICLGPFDQIEPFIEEEEEIIKNEQIIPKISLDMTSNDFVLEFSKILLNRK